MIAFALYFTIGTTGDMVILKMPSQIWLLPYCRPRILGMPSYLEALLLHTKTFHTSCLGSSSFPKWAKLANIVPSMDINISNLPMCCYLLLPRGFFFFFFFVFVFGKHLATWNTTPLSIHSRNHSTFTCKTFSNIQTKTLL